MTASAHDHAHDRAFDHAPITSRPAPLACQVLRGREQTRALLGEASTSWSSAPAPAAPSWRASSRATGALGRRPRGRRPLHAAGVRRAPVRRSRSVASRARPACRSRSASATRRSSAFSPASAWAARASSPAACASASRTRSSTRWSDDLGLTRMTPDGVDPYLLRGRGDLPRRDRASSHALARDASSSSKAPRRWASR